MDRVLFVFKTEGTDITVFRHSPLQKSFGKLSLFIVYYVGGGGMKYIQNTEN